MELTWLGIYLRLRMIVHDDHVLVLSTGKYMDSITGTGNVNVKDHTRISARASIHVGICAVSWVDMGGGGKTIHKHFQYGTVHYSSGPLGPLHSADPTSGRGQYGMTIYRA